MLVYAARQWDRHPSSEGKVQGTSQNQKPEARKQKAKLGNWMRRGVNWRVNLVLSVRIPDTCKGLKIEVLVEILVPKNGSDKSWRKLVLM